MTTVLHPHQKMKPLSGELETRAQVVDGQSARLNSCGFLASTASSTTRDRRAD
jgi:hypothetical protein